MKTQTPLQMIADVLAELDAQVALKCAKRAPRTWAEFAACCPRTTREEATV